MNTPDTLTIITASVWVTGTVILMLAKVWLVDVLDDESNYNAVAVLWIFVVILACVAVVVMVVFYPFILLTRGLEKVSYKLKGDSDE